MNQVTLFSPRGDVRQQGIATSSPRANPAHSLVCFRFLTALLGLAGCDAPALGLRQNETGKVKTRGNLAAAAPFSGSLRWVIGKQPMERRARYRLLCRVLGSRGSGPGRGRILEICLCCVPEVAARGGEPGSSCAASPRHGRIPPLPPLPPRREETRGCRRAVSMGSTQTSALHPHFGTEL